MRPRHVLVLLALLLAVPAASAHPWTGADPDQVTVDLVTALPGHNIGSAWYGHTGLLVRGPDTTTFYAYRLDIEDSPLRAATTAFTDVGFSLHAFTWEGRIEDYVAQERGLYTRSMDLDAGQKEALFAGMEAGLDRANATYMYQILHDNCATRLRDLIDTALGGALHAASSEPIGMSFRDFGPTFIEHDPVQATLMYAWLGSPVDKGLTQWDTMAFPLDLEAGVEELGILGAPVVVLDIPAPAGGPGHGVLMGSLVCIGLLLAAPFLLVAVRTRAGDPRPHRALGRLFMATGVLSLPFGIMNVLSWTDLLSLPWQHSYALLLTGPILGWPVLGGLLRRGRGLRVLRGWMHASAVLVGASVFVLALGVQDLSTPMALFVPVQTAALVAVEVTAGAVRAGSAPRPRADGAPAPRAR